MKQRKKFIQQPYINVYFSLFLFGYKTMILKRSTGNSDLSVQSKLFQEHRSRPLQF